MPRSRMSPFPPTAVILKILSRSQWLISLDAADRRLSQAEAARPKTMRTNQITSYHIRCLVRRPCQLMHSRCSRDPAMKLRCATRWSAIASSFLSSPIRTAREFYLNRSRWLPKRAQPTRLSSFLAALALSPSRWPIGLTRLIEWLYKVVGEEATRSAFFSMTWPSCVRTVPANTPV
jgi:hypothetical protein